LALGIHDQVEICQSTAAAGNAPGYVLNAFDGKHKFELEAFFGQVLAFSIPVTEKPLLISRPGNRGKQHYSYCQKSLSSFAPICRVQALSPKTPTDEKVVA
jgi:hypothetical protein